jgi:hypothetical protein
VRKNLQLINICPLPIGVERAGRGKLGWHDDYKRTVVYFSTQPLPSPLPPCGRGGKSPLPAYGERVRERESSYLLMTIPKIST